MAKVNSVVYGMMKHNIAPIVTNVSPDDALLIVCGRQVLLDVVHLPSLPSDNFSNLYPKYYKHNDGW